MSSRNIYFQLCFDALVEIGTIQIKGHLSVQGFPSKGIEKLLGILFEAIVIVVRVFLQKQFGNSITRQVAVRSKALY